MASTPRAGRSRRGTQLFIDRIGLDELPARREAIRGTFDPLYLVYTLGKLEILKWRDEWLGSNRGDLKLLPPAAALRRARPLPPWVGGCTSSELMSGRQRALLVLAGTNCLWAGSYVAGKAALATWPFASVNMLRFTIAAAILLPVLWQGRQYLPRASGDRWRLVAIMRLFGFVGNKALEYLGLSLTTATDTALLIAAEALATVLISAAVLSERIRRLEGAGLLLGGVGVYLVVEGGLKPPTLFWRTAWAIYSAAASLIMEAGFTVIGRTVVTRYPPLLITAVVVTGSLIAVACGNCRARSAGLAHLDLGRLAGDRLPRCHHNRTLLLGLLSGLKWVMPGRWRPRSSSSPSWVLGWPSGFEESIRRCRPY